LKQVFMITVLCVCARARVRACVFSLHLSKVWFMIKKMFYALCSLLVHCWIRT